MEEPAEETAEAPPETAEIATTSEAPAKDEAVPPTPVPAPPSKSVEKVECSLCGKAMNKKNLPVHQRERCKQRPQAPKVTAVPVAPVKPKETPGAPPQPPPLERHPPKSQEPEEDYDEKVEEAEAYVPVRQQRTLTRVDRMRLLAQSGLP